jgi:hypothetical protein
MTSTVNINEIIRRALKYIIQGITVALAAYYIPYNRSTCKLNFKEVTMISIVAVVTFAILDMYTPSISANK